MFQRAEKKYEFKKNKINDTLKYGHFKTYARSCKKKKYRNHN